MKRILSYIFILAVMVNFTACDDGSVMWDDANKFVAFTASTASFPEQNGGGQIEVMIAGLDGAAGTVTLEVTVEGIDKPATEGTDFSLSTTQVSFPNGSGIVSIDVDVVDNDVFTGNRQFKVKISSNSLGLPVGASNEMVVTLVDNEHPLANWLGVYVVNAVSYWSPGEYDETWNLTTLPDEDDVNKLWITGFSGNVADTIQAIFDKDAMTITVPKGQNVGNINTYGPTDVIWATPDFQYDTSKDLVGTISNDGSIHVDNWGHVISEGPNAGYEWDVFDTYWTKQ